MPSEKKQETEAEVGDIQHAAKLLGRSLAGQVPHVVGVSLRRSNPNEPKLDLYVDVDSEGAAAHIPRTFQGYKIHIRRVGTPQFAAD
jgi:hypothetical protein